VVGRQWAEVEPGDKVRVTKRILPKKLRWLAGFTGTVYATYHKDDFDILHFKREVPPVVPGWWVVVLDRPGIKGGYTTHALPETCLELV